MRLRDFTLFAVAPGVTLFSLTLIRYFAFSADHWPRAALNAELPAIAVVLSVSLYLAIVARRRQGLPHHIGYCMGFSAGAGAVWAVLMLLYIVAIDPHYPTVVAQRAIPQDARGAETTVLPATIEFIERPIVQLCWRPILCGVWGLIFVGALSAIHTVTRSRTLDVNS
jgi:hypothetical protein